MFPVVFVGIHPELPVVVPEVAKIDPAELVAEFLLKFTVDVDGAKIPFAEFRRRLNDWSGANLSDYRVSKSLPPRNASGAGNGNKTFVINRAWLDTPVVAGIPLVVEGGRIKKVKAGEGVDPYAALEDFLAANCEPTTDGNWVKTTDLLARYAASQPLHDMTLDGLLEALRRDERRWNVVSKNQIRWMKWKTIQSSEG